MSKSLPSSFDGDTEFYEESRFQKFTRRLKEEPLVPFGCGLTCWALYGATRSMRAGDHHTTNRMFRARIVAQGFTLVCIVAGSIYYAEDRAKRKVFDGAVAQRKAQEKNEAWIRELEARDQEEKELQAKKEELRKARSGGSDIKAENNEIGVAKSILDECELRRSLGVLDAVKELWRK